MILWNNLLANNIIQQCMSIFSFICFGLIFLFLFIGSNTFLDAYFLDLNCTAQARGRLIREYMQ